MRFRSNVLFVVGLAIMLGAFGGMLVPSSPAQADGNGISLIDPINAVGLLEPPDPPPPGGAQFYSWTGPAPNWNIAQWNIPGDKLSPFKTTVNGAQTIYSSSAQEASVTLTQTGSTITSVALSQDGSILPCEIKAHRPRAGNPYRPRESDLFISANGLRKKPPGVANMPLLGTPDNPSLAQLKRVVFTGQVSISQGIAATDNFCTVNQGSALIGVILSDDTTHQTLFYKTALNQFCGNGSAEQVAKCSKMPDRQRYYFKTNPFGVDDFLPFVGQPFMADGSNENLSLDLLPRMLAVIDRGPPDIDKDPSHWVIGGFYYGQHIWGGVRMRSTWQNVTFMAYTN